MGNYQKLLLIEIVSLQVFRATCDYFRTSNKVVYLIRLKQTLQLYFVLLTTITSLAGGIPIGHEALAQTIGANGENPAETSTDQSAVVRASTSTCRCVAFRLDDIQDYLLELSLDISPDSPS